jgi:diguanylate cyclase (GGDEF)-like protein
MPHAIAFAASLAAMVGSACGAARCAWATTPAPLTTLSAVHRLSNAEAHKGLPVAFEATVTYYRDSDTDLFVQDGNTAIYVDFKPDAELVPGDRVLVIGKTQDSFRPIIEPDSVVVVHRGALIAPVAASFESLIRAELDCKRIRIRGVVRSAAMVDAGRKRSIYLEVLTDGGYIDVALNSNDESAQGRLLDAEVEFTGIATAKFDQKMQMSGARIDVQSLADVKILKPAAQNTGTLALTPLEDVIGNYKIQDLSRRVRIRGTINYYQAGSNIVLQDGSKSLWITTNTSQPLRVGDIAEVTGFPSVRDGYVGLIHGGVKDTGVYAPIPPLPVNWQELGFGGNAFNLVTIEARLVRQVREAATDEYVLDADGHVFSAIFRHPLPIVSPQPPPVKWIPEGAKVRVTGIGMFYSTDSFNGPIASDILMQSLDDIAVIAPPPLLSVRNLTLAVGLLLLGIFAVSIWGWLLERKVRQQSVAMAARNEAEATLQRQRSQILEDINGTQPLAEIVEAIVHMVSYQLGGAPCWCEIADGARLGDEPSDKRLFRIARKEIASRSGPLLGTIFAGLDPGVPPSASEAESLSVGTRLATLAIETQRLYTDLHHRSDFDLLTDIHNRFSLDRYLNVCIAEAHQTASVFGLIYIDLDEFKQVNDLYGHHAGDLYLQEVTARMKRQLRSADMLARLGGDEFAVLTPDVRSRLDVEEISIRLQRCFVDPFVIEGHRLQGAVSIGIAMYPQHGVTRDALLNAADAAMYKSKHARRVEARARSLAVADLIENAP